MTSRNKRKQQRLFQALIPFSLLVGITGFTLISLVSSAGWNLPLELLCNFKLQYFFIVLLLFSLITLTRRKKLILIALLCLILHLPEVVYWYIPQETVKGAAAGAVRIFVSNINTQNRNYGKLISQLQQEQPDIVVLMEIDDTWTEQLESLISVFPYSIEKPNPYNLGLAVYSKFPLEKPVINFFGTRNNPTILADLVINNTVVSLIATHPFPPIRRTLFHSRNQQLKEISQYVKQLKNPVVMVGDLNITMWSKYHKNFTHTSELRNARKGFGILPTWPAKSSFSRVPTVLVPLLAIPIDHCLVSSDIKVLNIRTGRNLGSDHLPLITDLIIPRGNSTPVQP